MRNRKGIAGIFRVIAGGYLIYLGVKLIRDGLLTGAMQGTSKVVGILASVLFIVFGAFFAVHAILFMSKQSEQEEDEQEEEVEEVEAQPVEEAVSGTPSLFDRAGFGALRGDEDEDEEEASDEEDPAADEVEDPAPDEEETENEI